MKLTRACDIIYLGRSLFIMDISKTLFKLYSKCNCIYAIDQIYKQKYNTNYDNNDIKSILAHMFSDDGDDLISVTDEQIEVMLPYYQKTEEIALLEASNELKCEFTYQPNTLDQKSFRFKDHEGNNIYTYLDGYYENSDSAIVIEVKTTTDKKYLKLGPKVKGNIDCIFEKNGRILKLKENLTDKQITFLNKIYDPNSDEGKYFFDLAITKYIIDKSGNNLKTKYYLAVLNSSYVFDGTYVNGNPSYYSGNEDIITLIDATDILPSYYEVISQMHQEIIEEIKSAEIKNAVLKKECLKCPYQKVCHSNLNMPGSIVTLLNPKKVDNKSVYELYNSGCYLIKDLNDKQLEGNHLIQYNALIDKAYYDNEQIKEQIDKIVYPIYHLDFEAFNGPLPRFVGETPFTQSVFQFSLHIEKTPGKCDRYEDNYYFLPNDFADHREELIKEMIRLIDLSKGGTVLVYNKTFESSRIKELMKIYPQYQNELNLINSHIFDLMDVVKGSKKEKVNFYDKRLEGSYSIKKVLPIFSNLTYKELFIHNGVEAIVNYAKFKDLGPLDIEEIRKKLIEYCGLDTYSMVVILNQIRKEIGYNAN